MADNITYDDLNYFQRFNHSFSNFHKDSAASDTVVPRINFYKIKQISVLPKQDKIPTEYLLCGLHGSNIPIAFLIKKDAGNISISIGVWQQDKLNYDEEDIKSLLKTIYPFINIEKDLSPLLFPEKLGIVLGLPSAKLLLSEKQTQMPIDRLIQALNFASDVQCLVLASPNNEITDNSFLNGSINELRKVLTIVHDRKVPNPIADHYAEILKTAIKNAEIGKEIGSWKTAVYLATTKADFSQLSSLWKAIFSGDDSLVEPIRMGEINISGDPNRIYLFPETPGKSGPGNFRHLFHYLTMMNSRQLANYIHFPNYENPAISVIRVPEFDSVAQNINSKETINLGKIIYQKEVTENPYYIDVGKLKKHCFVSGSTGSGKTNTIFKLLIELNSRAVNFLVIESAKAEYRSLKNHPEFKNLQVFTLGNETVSPFRLNPFEVFPGIPVSVHLDLLRSVFIAGFGMWTPLPQVLEQCLHKIYEDKGWDLSMNTNNRFQADENSTLAFPTITDLYNKIKIVSDELGYDEKTRDDIKAALLTRVNSLRIGGKGKMLDTRVSIPMEALLSQPTILELEGIGDDEDKAFIMGLLFIRLVEYRRIQNKEDAHQHILVIEEAHRLLTTVSSENSEAKGNSKGKAVETFANLLSEIRAYKQGVIISDQIPVKLSPDIIKNTNLKIAHRIISKDDREVLGGSMALEQEKLVHFSTLEQGEAIIFAEGDDAPLLVKIGKCKDALTDTPVSNQQISEAMKPFADYTNYKSPLIQLIQQNSPDKNYNFNEPAAWKIAALILDDPNVKRDFVRFMISITESEESFDKLFKQLIERFHFFYDYKTDQKLINHYAIIYLIEWFTEYRGDRYKWAYSKVIELQNKLHSMLFKKTDIALKEFRDLMYSLHSRAYDPFPRCIDVCSQKKNDQLVCLYRQPVEDYIKNNDENMLLKQFQNDIYAANENEITGMARSIAGTILPAGINNEISKRVASCYILHMLRHEVIGEYDILNFNL